MTRIEVVRQHFERCSLCKCCGSDIDFLLDLLDQDRQAFEEITAFGQKLRKMGIMPISVTIEKLAKSRLEELSK